MIPKDPVNILIPGREQRNIQEKAILRQKNRAYVIKEMSNPFRHAYGPPYLEDMGLVRAEAQNSFASERKYFKANAKTFAGIMKYYILPTLVFAYLCKTSRDAFDHKCRTGQIAYRDRNFKFI